MAEGKLLPYESESPGFLMFLSNCYLIRGPLGGPLMSCLSSQQLAQPWLRGVVPMLPPLEVISSRPLGEDAVYILFVANLNPSC